MSAQFQGGGPAVKKGPVSRIYETLAIDDGGDLRVRRTVRRAIEQLVRFLSHYAAAVKRQRAAALARAGRAPGSRESNS